MSSSSSSSTKVQFSLFSRASMLAEFEYPVSQNMFGSCSLSLSSNSSLKRRTKGDVSDSMRDYKTAQASLKLFSGYGTFKVKTTKTFPKSRDLLSPPANFTSTPDGAQDETSYRNVLYLSEFRTQKYFFSRKRKWKSRD